ncbi:hypothetical protein PoB_001180700 [Plakobranchus ocellatus]|uniref:Uncharacterized protein n=1 Tax=Plakobranchus ocellatus TaxID=259542 RepID=A0AAV3YS41_9GAST|nr:hypothetical protein PoB_001180700 [Plakobranchus ocellatus]
MLNKRARGVFYVYSQSTTRCNPGFQTLRETRTPVVALEPAIEGSLQISGRIRYPLATNSLKHIQTQCQLKEYNPVIRHTIV